LGAKVIRLFFKFVFFVVKEASGEFLLRALFRSGAPSDIAIGGMLLAFGALALLVARRPHSRRKANHRPFDLIMRIGRGCLTIEWKIEYKPPEDTHRHD
jgi:hypothetical protein